MRWLLDDVAVGAATAAQQAYTAAAAAGSTAAGVVKDAAETLVQAANSQPLTTDPVTSRSAAAAADMALATTASNTGSELLSIGMDSAAGADVHPVHIDVPHHSLWHGPGGVFVALLIFAHVAAFLYWAYLVYVSKKFEKGKSKREVLRKQFKCVYEWGMNTAVELMPLRKPKLPQSPRDAPTHSPQAPPHSPFSPSNSAAGKPSSQAFTFNKMFKPSKA